VISDTSYLRLHTFTLVFFAVVTFAKIAYVRFSGVPVAVDTDLIGVSVILLVAGFAALFTGWQRIALTLNLFGVVLMGFNGSGIVTAVFAHTGRSFPFIDDLLVRADHALGFDWRAHAEWVLQHPVVRYVLEKAYLSIMYQAVFILGFLIYDRHILRAYTLLSAMLVALIVTSFIALFFPALGPFEYFHGSTLDFANGDLVTAGHCTEAILWMRAGTFDTALPKFLGGLVYFPSYHAVTAVLYIWAAWKTPGLRWIFLGLNVLMIASTPAHGSHYLTDTIAGIAVAIACLWAVVPVTRRLMPSLTLS
jgi:hypothetical protein